MMLERFNMAEAVITSLADHFRIILRPVSNYQERRRNVSSFPYACAVGSLMYAMVCSRPDLAYAGIRKSVHVKSRKATLGGSEVDIQMSTRDCDARLGKPRTLQGYTDVDVVFGGDFGQQRSITGFVFTLAKCVI